MVLFKLGIKHNKTFRNKYKLFINKNKRIFAFLGIQKRKRNEMNFFSKGQQKTKCLITKKRNIDIPSLHSGSWQECELTISRFSWFES